MVGLGRSERNPRLTNPRAILAFRSAALGDFVMACPALRVLRETFPQSKIVLLTTQSANAEQRRKVANYAGNTSSVPWVQLARPHLLDEVLVLDGPRSPRGLLGLRRTIGNIGCELGVLLLEPGAPWGGRIKKLMLMRLLLGAVPVVGWRGVGSFHRDRARLHKAGLLPHHVIGAMQFLEELTPRRSAADFDVVFDLRPDATARVWADAWVGENVMPSARLVAIAPGSIQPHKRWPLGSFLELSRLLLEEENVQIVVIGTRQDRELGDALMKVEQSRISNVAGATTIAQTAALLARCALLVGNDGGASHLGDAMGTKVVSIVPGLEHPNSIEPWHNQHLAVRHEVECAPCYSFYSCPAGHNRCMVDLPVERVLEKCRIALRRTQSSERTTS